MNILKEPLSHFLSSLFLELFETGVDVRDLFMDHVSYTCATVEDYVSLKGMFADVASLIDEKEIGGRPIAKFRLNQPITWIDPEQQKRVISLIEFPAPKPLVKTVEGWDHAEFVLKEPFIRFIRRYPSMYNLENSGFSSKNINPDVSLAFSIGGKIIRAKFHHCALERIIEIEKAIASGASLAKFKSELIPTAA